MTENKHARHCVNCGAHINAHTSQYYCPECAASEKAERINGLDPGLAGNIEVVSFSVRKGIDPDEYDIKPGSLIDSSSFLQSVRMGYIPPGYRVRRCRQRTVYQVEGEYGESGRLVRV